LLAATLLQREAARVDSSVAAIIDLSNVYLHRRHFELSRTQCKHVSPGPVVPGTTIETPVWAPGGQRQPQSPALDRVITHRQIVCEAAEHVPS